MSDEAPGHDLVHWMAQARKGILAFCILDLLSRETLCGYDLVKRIVAITGLVSTEGTIYPLLSRLRQAGLLETRLEESSPGPARKIYGLSDAGRHAHALMFTYWQDAATGVERLIEGSSEDERMDAASEGPAPNVYRRSNGTGGEQAWRSQGDRGGSPGAHRN